MTAEALVMNEHTVIPRCETVRDWMVAFGYRNRRSIDKLMAEGKLPPRVPGVGKVIWPPGTIRKYLDSILNQTT